MWDWIRINSLVVVVMFLAASPKLANWRADQDTPAPLAAEVDPAIFAVDDSEPACEPARETVHPLDPAESLAPTTQPLDPSNCVALLN